ncbi:hypothetical protein A3770_01p05830 [Chloropicon primus]|uniref:Uncharacterized protein n=1 Tax=Chloropicon primus TaxID=1764295 RepID=A0A5B8MEH7_9CHLO|nr:hypothetical protein A3770_01p05830 [Chloropicon primus]|eukprot:QDZ18065.1 hypothetical protein A3770_01p05830 [Chloropicon primus]
MESERRSTMSSLKGQLSNVEGSVKSMKAAVVAGSVLTVACLAAVFGVTILANEVSKEVKVSNGTLTAKNGQAVLTTNMYYTAKFSTSTAIVTLADQDMTGTFAVNTVVTQGTKLTLICDDVVVSQEGGETDVQVTEDSMLNNLSDSVEKRSVNNMCNWFGAWKKTCEKYSKKLIFAAYDYLWDNRQEIWDYGKRSSATMDMCGVACG